MKELFVVATMAVAAVAASAQVTVVGNWRLGDADPGASAGGASAGSTVDSASGTYALTRESNHVYSADTPAAALLSLSASSLSISFSGEGTYSTYYRSLGTGTAIPAHSENVGIEAWLKPANTASGSRVIVTVGDQDSGYAILQSGDALEVRYGTNGAALATFSGLSTTAWTHVALVRGTSTATFYVNGASSGTISAAVPAWGGSGEYFGIGGQPRGPGGQRFVGLIDEVRYFTFAGEFAVGSLNYVAPVPEPAGTAAGIGLAVLLAVAGRRRRGDASNGRPR